MEVAAEIRRRIHQLEDLFTKWSGLAESDRRSCDILRSLDPQAMNRLPTFPWVTATDGNMTEVLRELAQQRVRAEEDLKRRAEAARGGTSQDVTNPHLTGPTHTGPGLSLHLTRRP